MSTYTLKLIAIITMLIDHVGAVFISPGTNYWLYVLSRGIGRLALPIFAFLLVEGLYHTKDVKKYLLRLGVFALISEIPFDLAFNGKIISIGHQNIFFTLFLGLLLITLIKLAEKKFESQIMISNLFATVLTLVFCVVADFLKTDYGFKGIIIIVAFYLFRGRKVLLSLALLMITGYFLCDFQSFALTNNILDIISIFANLALIPILFYNGEKGKSIKYLFYVFYPAHLLVMALIKLYL